jgi:sugar phosphate isomerase/epimerase
MRQKISDGSSDTAYGGPVIAELGLCWGTIPRAPLLAHIDAAADAGYTSISISPEQYAGAKRSASELRSRLDDVGIRVDSVDPALTWLPGLRSMPGAGLLSYDVDDLLAAASALGAPWINAAAALPGPWSEAEITEAFAVLCARAGDAGIGVLLEFVPWSTVRDLTSAARVVRASGADNAGVTFDVWHFYRGGGRHSDVSADDLMLVHSIQINDAFETPATDPMTESISARLLPGDGAILLTELIPRLLDGAPTDVLSIEVFSADLRREPVNVVAKQAADAARRVLADCIPPA